MEVHVTPGAMAGEAAATRSSFLRVAAIVAAGLLIGLAAALAAPPAQAATTEGAVISNGTVQLGVNKQGDLNYDCNANADPVCPPASVETDVVGLRFVPLNLESTAPGCLCEGWGVADAGSGLTGSANEDFGPPTNLTIDSFTATDTQAISKVTISDPAVPGFQIQVTQDYHPSAASPNVYLNTVTVQNTGANAITDLRYRRVMDWDVEPTAFDEFSTIQGGAAQLLFTSDDGFHSPDPLSGPSYINSEVICGSGYTGPCTFIDLGSGGTHPPAPPDDIGALFDFGFGALGVGETRTFTVLYGAADSETNAINALNASGAQVYSLGESSCQGETVADCSSGSGDAGPTLGKPATFMFAFVTASSDLSIKKGGPKSAEVGEKFRWNVTVTNKGPDEARGVVVTDELPKDVKFVSASSDKGTCAQSTSDPSVVTCDVGQLDNGAKAKIKISVKGQKAGDVKNTATVSSISEDKVAGNNKDSAKTTIGRKAKQCPGITVDGKVITGDNGNDNLKGTGKNDHILAKGGNDKASGKGGDDCVIGQPGKDKMKGGSGDDVIRGGKDNDKASGGAGNDEIKLQEGNDDANGGSGKDFIKAQGRGSDVVTCGSGKDKVIGDEKDTIAKDCEKVKLV